MKSNIYTLLIAYIMLLICVHPAFTQERRAKLRSLAAGKKAMELYRAGQYDESAVIFKQILEKNRKNIISKEMLALIGFNTKNVDMAQQYARSALQQNNRSVRAHLVLAYVSREKGNRLAALDHYRKAQKYSKTQNEKDFIKEHALKLDRPQREDIVHSMSAVVKEIPSDTRPYVAVFVFEESGEDSISQLGQMVSEMLITALLQTGRFTVFERSQLDKLLEEQALGLSGALDTETAVDIGQLIGVDAILTGSCSRIGKRIELDARIIQAASAEIKVAANSSAQTEQNVRQAVEEIAKKLAASVDKVEKRAVEQAGD